MNKKAITTVSCSFVNDRIASNPVNLNSIYIKASDNDANTNYLTLPQEKYFNSTSFTIIFWINVFTVPSAGKQARVIDFSDADTKKNGIAVFIQPGTTSANVSIDNSPAVVLETVVDGAITAVSDKGAGFALKTWTHVAITVSTSGSTITTAIYYNANTTGITLSNATAISNLPAKTTSFTTNFIGNGAKPGKNEVNLDAYLNDVKIFDSALSATQVSSQYTSEKCNVYFSILFKFILF
jgi:hypothetical protein